MTATDPTLLPLADIIAAMGWQYGPGRDAMLYHDRVTGSFRRYADGHVWNPRYSICDAMDIVEGLTRTDRPGQRLYFKMTYRPGVAWVCFDREATAGMMVVTRNGYEGEALTMAEAIYLAACQVVLAERET